MKKREFTTTIYVIEEKDGIDFSVQVLPNDEVLFAARIDSDLMDDGDMLLSISKDEAKELAAVLLELAK